MKVIKFLTIAMSLLFVAGIESCDKREQNVLFPPGIKEDLVEMATKEGLTTFVAALKATGIDKEFDFLGQYTILAPNDAAFTAIGVNAGNVGTAVPTNVLRSILRNHIISGRVPSANLLPGPNAIYTSLQRDLLNTSTYSGAVAGLFFNGKKVLKTNVQANNGVIHVIDGVLAPPIGNLSAVLAANPNLSFLAAAIARAGLTTTLNTTTTSLTIFAPTNAAFIAAGFPDIATINAAAPATLATILTYHVIPAASLTSTSLTSPLNRNGRAFSVDFVNGTTLVTAQGSTVGVIVSGVNVSIKGTTNTTASNITIANTVYYGGNVSSIRPGVLHVIDQLLLP